MQGTSASKLQSSPKCSDVCKESWKIGCRNRSSSILEKNQKQLDEIRCNVYMHSLRHH